MEERLVHDPDCWLAHATLAVAARLDGDDEIRLTAMGPAQGLDLGKANLFFSLAAARTGEREQGGELDGRLPPSTPSTRTDSAGTSSWSSTPSPAANSATSHTATPGR